MPTISQLLDDLAVLAGDLTIQATRQGRSAQLVRANITTTPSPVMWRQAEALREIAQLLDDLADQVNHGEPFPPPGIPSVVDWLKPRLLHHEVAHTALRRVQQIIETSTPLIDRHGGLIYAGPCNPPECMVDLLRLPHERIITCQACRRTHDVHKRLEWLMAHCRDMILPAPLIEAALTLFGMTVTANRVRVWAHRGKIRQHSGRAGEPAYLVEDVLTLLTGEAQRHNNTRQPARKGPDRQTTVRA